MTDTPTQSERAEFRAFCEAASPTQLPEIERKEREAGRAAFADIAREVMAGWHRWARLN